MWVNGASMCIRMWITIRTNIFETTEQRWLTGLDDDEYILDKLAPLRLILSRPDTPSQRGRAS